MGKAKGQAEEIEFYVGSGGSRTPKGLFVTLSPYGGIGISPELTEGIDPMTHGACRVGRMRDPDRLVLEPTSRQTPNALCWSTKPTPGKTFRLSGAGVLKKFGLTPSAPIRLAASWQGDRIVAVLGSGERRPERRPRAQKPAAKAAAATPVAEVGKALCSDCAREVRVQRVGRGWVMAAHEAPDGPPCTHGRPIRIHRI